MPVTPSPDVRHQECPKVHSEVTAQIQKGPRPGPHHVLLRTSRHTGGALRCRAATAYHALCSTSSHRAPPTCHTCHIPGKDTKMTRRAPTTQDSALIETPGLRVASHEKAAPPPRTKRGRERWGEHSWRRSWAMLGGTSRQPGRAWGASEELRPQTGNCKWTGSKQEGRLWGM